MKHSILAIRYLLLVILLVFAECRTTIGQPIITKHRIQDSSTKDASGWYYAKSTEGHFSVLMPIPFNDATISAHDDNIGLVKTHLIGGTSAEGIKITANEMDAEHPKDFELESLLSDVTNPSDTVSDVIKSATELSF